MFRKLSQWWLGLLYTFMGQWVVDCLEPPQSKREIVLQHTEDDHGLIVFCEEIHYEIQFRRWWVPNVRYSMYKFTALCTGQSPERMRKATHESAHFPMMMGSVFTRANNRKHMLNVFVKLIVTRMRTIIETEESHDSSSF